MAVLVYTQPGCGPCKATVRSLERTGVEHELVDITEHPEGADFIRNHGWQATPVVNVTDDEGTTVAAWQGFRPEHITALGRTDEVDPATLDERPGLVEATPGVVNE